MRFPALALPSWPKQRTSKRPVTAGPVFTACWKTIRFAQMAGDTAECLFLLFVNPVRSRIPKRSSVRVLHARPEVADLLGHPCKTQSRNQIAVLEYVTGFERVVEDLRGAYRICTGFKD